MNNRSPITKGAQAVQLTDWIASAIFHCSMMLCFGACTAGDYEIQSVSDLATTREDDCTIVDEIRWIYPDMPKVQYGQNSKCKPGKIQCTRNKESRLRWLEIAPADSIPVTEGTLCNGIDDDCDGKIDEDAKYGMQLVGEICTTGNGKCMTNGTVVCLSTSANGSPPSCNAVMVNPNSPESYHAVAYPMPSFKNVTTWDYNCNGSPDLVICSFDVSVQKEVTDAQASTASCMFPSSVLLPTTSGMIPCTAPCTSPSYQYVSATDQSIKMLSLENCGKSIRLFKCAMDSLMKCSVSVEAWTIFCR